MHNGFNALMKGEGNGSYLKRVDVQSSHWPRVPVALSNDHVSLPSHDLSGVVQDDVAVLASRDEDSRRVAAAIYSMCTPHQLVVSVGGSWVMSRCTEGEKVNLQAVSVFFFPIPVGGGEVATRLHFQTWVRKVQLKKLQGSICAEGSVQLLS